MAQASKGCWRAEVTPGALILSKVSETFERTEVLCNLGTEGTPYN